MKVELTEQGVTKDTGDIVFKIETSAKSWAMGCFTKEKIVIWNIHSHQKGDMKRMLNEAVKKIGLNQIMFTSVLGMGLVEKLKGFKARKMMHPQIGEMMVVLEGKWGANTA